MNAPDKKKVNYWNVVATTLVTLLIGSIWSAIAIFMDLKRVPGQFDEFKKDYREVQKEWQLKIDRISERQTLLEQRIIKLEERTRNRRN